MKSNSKGVKSPLTEAIDLNLIVENIVLYIHE